jgi:hypothetical protein
MNKKDGLKLLRRWAEAMDMPKCERVYKRVKTRRGLLMPLPVNPTEEQIAMWADRRPGSPTRYPEAFQARLIPQCQRAIYRGMKRRMLASL